MREGAARADEESSANGATNSYHLKMATFEMPREGRVGSVLRGAFNVIHSVVSAEGADRSRMCIRVFPEAVDKTCSPWAVVIELLSILR